MATFDDYTIYKNGITLKFSAGFFFSKDVFLDFEKDKDKIIALVNKVIDKLNKSDDDDLEFYYDGHDIEASRSLLGSCVKAIKRHYQSK